MILPVQYVPPAQVIEEPTLVGALIIVLGIWCIGSAVFLLIYGLAQANKRRHEQRIREAEFPIIGDGAWRGE